MPSTYCVRSWHDLFAIAKFVVIWHAVHSQTSYAKPFRSYSLPLLGTIPSHNRTIRPSAPRSVRSAICYARSVKYGVQTKGHGTKGHRTKGHRQKATKQKATETKGHGTKVHRTQRQDAILSCQDVLERLWVVLKTVEEIVLSSVLVCRPSLFVVYLSSVLVNCSTTATACSL